MDLLDHQAVNEGQAQDPAPGGLTRRGITCATCATRVCVHVGLSLECMCVHARAYVFGVEEDAELTQLSWAISIQDWTSPPSWGFSCDSLTQRPVAVTAVGFLQHSQNFEVPSYRSFRTPGTDWPDPPPQHFPLARDFQKGPGFEALRVPFPRAVSRRFWNAKADR